MRIYRLKIRNIQISNKSLCFKDIFNYQLRCCSCTEILVKFDQDKRFRYSSNCSMHAKICNWLHTNFLFFILDLYFSSFVVCFHVPPKCLNHSQTSSTNLEGKCVQFTWQSIDCHYLCMKAKPISLLWLKIFFNKLLCQVMHQ